MIWVYAVSFVFVFLYAWGGNTNGTWSPKIMVLGVLGFVVTLLVSVWLSLQAASWLCVHVLWSTIVGWIILAFLFKKIFKHSWVDNTPPSQRQIKKVVRKMSEGK